MIYKFNYIKIKILGYQKTLRNITTCRKYLQNSMQLVFQSQENQIQ